MVSTPSIDCAARLARADRAGTAREAGSTQDVAALAGQLSELARTLQQEEDLEATLAGLDDADTRTCVDAERTLLAVLEARRRLRAGGV